MYRQRALEERSRPRQIALRLKHTGEMLKARRRIWMLRAEHLFVYRERTLVEPPRFSKVTLILKQGSKQINARRCPRVLWAVVLFVYCQSALQEVGCFRVRRTAAEIFGCSRQEGRLVIRARQHMWCQLSAKRPRFRIVAVLW